MSSKGKECIIDAESLEFLRQKRAHDRTIVASLGLERQDAEFRNGHAERLNNWKTDEIYIERSQEEEANFLHNLAIEEQKSFLVLQAEEVKEEESIEEDRTVFGKIMSDMKDLKLQCLQNKAAAELRKSQKKTLRSRRIAVQVGILCLSV
ncbi:hypothetical protein BC829DRAFT_96037 [Chytridium lagenaria]|nr:hypothetical protein BC829DRAFT_96037 [Chytridium lagenaria]